MDKYYVYSVDVFVGDKLLDCVTDVVQIQRVEELSQEAVKSLITEYIVSSPEFSQAEGIISVTFRRLKEHQQINYH